MAWLAVDKDGAEYIYNQRPTKSVNLWYAEQAVDLPKGIVEKLIGKQLTWEDEPVELK